MDIIETSNRPVEIEVTSEMVEAGAKVLRGFSEDYETYGDGALEVYKAMELARRAS